ncbi:alpha/beta hydrolase [Mucilaginibacter roseus]|uniref:Alpha/beta hydrolase n=1 Tax=Mucilaginibacter roseus TaxID=1528868 RepID=A0ABS8TZE0_9SPHI|nr:alpha/beta hydrolase [Mucilaginibacter roseus]MCD8739019.1 alpha/beta hydrolase [Mucilaginibacter roseus]
MSGFKTAHLLAEDFKHVPTSQLFIDMTNQFHQLDINRPEHTKALLAQMNADQLNYNIANSPSPTGKLVAPANGQQPAVELYTFHPEAKEQGKYPVIYFIHASGYLLGNARQQNQSLFELANETGAIVVSVEYRMAGEAPYPADINDAYHGLSYLIDHAEKLGFDQEKIIVMGESAGGGLAARLALKVRDLGEFTLKGQVLVCPMLDYRTGSDESLYNNPYAGEFIWLPKFNYTAWQMLKAGQNIPAEEMPYYSASLATDLSKLPQTFIAVGSLDLFVNENIDYANRLIASGVQTDLLVLNGVPHGIDVISPESPQAKLYLDARSKIMASMLGSEA